MITSFRLNPTVTATINGVIPNTSHKPGDIVELTKATRTGGQVKIGEESRYTDVRHFTFDHAQKRSLDEQVASSGAVIDESVVMPPRRVGRYQRAY